MTVPIWGQRIACFISDAITLGCCVLLCHGTWKQVPVVIVGTVLNVVARENLGVVTCGVWPFLVAQLLLLGLLIIFPALGLVPARWFY